MTRIFIENGDSALCPICNKIQKISEITFDVASDDVSFVKLDCNHQLVFWSNK